MIKSLLKGFDAFADSLLDPLVAKLRRPSAFEPSRRRRPGQSLEEKFNDISIEALTAAMIFSCALVTVPLLWLPKTISVTFLIIVAFGALYIHVRKMQALSRHGAGLRGEWHVADKLNELERDGARVIHDVVGDTFNIDHILICKAGVFALETKFLSYRGGEKVLYFDGSALSRNGTKLKGDPAQQAKLAVRDIKGLMDTIESRCPVRGVTLFPGWCVKPPPPDHELIWVANETLFINRVRDMPRLMKDETIEKIYRQLSQHLEQPSRFGVNRPKEL